MKDAASVASSHGGEAPGNPDNVLTCETATAERIISSTAKKRIFNETSGLGTFVETTESFATLLKTPEKYDLMSKKKNRSRTPVPSPPEAFSSPADCVSPTTRSVSPMFRRRSKGRVIRVLEQLPVEEVS